MEDASREDVSEKSAPRLDGSFVDDVLPPVGQTFFPQGGIGRHLRRTWGYGWLVIMREISPTTNVVELGFYRQAKDATERFQKARRSECKPGWVVEAHEAVIGGWRLLDRAPWIRATRGLSAPESEVIWGQNGEAIALTRPHRPAQWGLAVPDPERSHDGQIVFGPFTIRNGLHRSRAAAIAAAEKHAPESLVDDGGSWVRTWSQPITRLRTAGIASTFGLSVEFLGPTGVQCTGPQCAAEAFMKVSRSGTDVGVESRLACNAHAGEAMARQSLA